MGLVLKNVFPVTDAVIPVRMAEFGKKKHQF